MSFGEAGEEGREGQPAGHPARARPLDRRQRETDDAEILRLTAKGLLYKLEDYTHRYPVCWRCKNPTLFLATEQWFIALDKNGDTRLSGLVADQADAGVF